MNKKEFVTMAARAWDLMESNPQFLGSIELNVWRYTEGLKHEGRIGWIYNLNKGEGTHNKDPKDFEADFNRIAGNHPRSWWRWDCK